MPGDPTTPTGARNAQTVAPRRLTATTPHGTFTRRTGNAYGFVAVIERIDGASFNFANRDGTRHAIWSRTQQLAQKNARSTFGVGKPGSGFVCLGLYPVDAEEAR